MQRLYILLLLLSLSVPCLSENEDEEANQPGMERLRDLRNKVELYYCTAEGLMYIDTLMETAAQYSNKEMYEAALEYKAGTYINMKMYNELDQYVDSLKRQTNIESEYLTAYNYITYVHTMSFIYRAKYKLAIQQAQLLYDNSTDYIDKEPIFLGENTGYEIPSSLANRISSLRCLGMAYSKLHYYDEAIKYFEEAIAIAQKWPRAFYSEIIDLNSDLMLATFNIKSKEKSLMFIKRFEKALDYYHREGLKIDNNDMEFYTFLLEIAYSETYSYMHDTKNAKIHLDNMCEILKTSEIAQYYISNYYKAQALYNREIGEYDLSAIYADSAARVCHEDGDLEDEIVIHKIGFDATMLNRDYKKACDIAQNIISLSDTLSDMKFRSSIDEMSAIVGLDKMQLETERLEADKRMLAMVAVITVMIAFMIIISIMIVQNRRRAEDRERILNEQKAVLEEEVKRQTSELVAKNKDITDSINYAQRIQNAILPSFNYYKQFGIQGAFTFYQPCDIVGGDFYWANKVGDELMFACADCTGHGVPGALMSMVGTTILNEICAEQKTKEPGEILEKLDKQLIEILNQNTDSDVLDGMDIALVAYNPKSKVLKFAGARRPMYLFHNNEMTETRGTRRSVGDRETKCRQRQFETHEMTISTNDIIYMFSDGFVDQFGGVKITGNASGDPYSTLRLQETLSKIQSYDIKDQHDLISKEFNDWMGECQQVDDVSLVGIRF